MGGVGVLRGRGGERWCTWCNGTAMLGSLLLKSSFITLYILL